MDKQRTIQQNKAQHLYFEQLAQKFNEAGLGMQKVLKPSIEIEWTKESVKKYLWKPIQEAMYSKKSTTELTTDEVTKVYEVLNRHTAEKFGVGVRFPSVDSLTFEAQLKEYKIT
jgi:hypothetical protein